jgi:hypothetical protein
VDVQADAQQRQPPQQNGENGGAYGLEQAQVQITPGPGNDDADDQVNEKIMPMGRLSMVVPLPSTGGLSPR